jgi:nicotinate-nucleotide adenylyltransferase
MCRLAVAGCDGVEACALEIERGSPSYTVDTLRAIHASHPHAELTFIVGADTARTLPSWREPRELLELARLAVAARPGTAREDVQRTLAELSGPRPARVCFLDMPEIEISSSAVRARAARGEPLQELVGADAAAYIEAHGLYRDSGGARP